MGNPGTERGVVFWGGERLRTWWQAAGSETRPRGCSDCAGLVRGACFAAHAELARQPRHLCRRDLRGRIQRIERRARARWARLATNDVIETTCAWKNTTTSAVKFGENTADEMCYSFTVYYPRINSGLWTWAGPALASQCTTTTN